MRTKNDKWIQLQRISFQKYKENPYEKEITKRKVHLIKCNLFKLKTRGIESVENKRKRWGPSLQIVAQIQRESSLDERSCIEVWNSELQFRNSTYLWFFYENQKMWKFQEIIRKNWKERKRRERKKKTCWSSSLGLDDQHHTLFIIKRRIFSEFIKKEWWYFLTKQSPTFLKLQKSPLHLTTSGMGDETCLRCETCFWNGELMQCHWSSFHKVDSISIFRMMLVGSLVQGWFLHCDLESFSFYSTLAFCTSSLS